MPDQLPPNPIHALLSGSPPSRVAVSVAQSQIDSQGDDQNWQLAVLRSWLEDDPREAHALLQNAQAGKPLHAALQAGMHYYAELTKLWPLEEPEPAEQDLSDPIAEAFAFIDREWDDDDSFEPLPRANVKCSNEAGHEVELSEQWEQPHEGLDHCLVATPGGSVLVIDDSPAVRRLVIATLERGGFRVISAADGKEALEVLKQENPTIILSDINMPLINGYQLCKMVKADENKCHIPFLLLSGRDGAFDKLRGTMVGCDDFLIKPFEPAKLLQKIREHVELARETKHNEAIQVTGSQ